MLGFLFGNKKKQSQKPLRNSAARKWQADGDKTVRKVNAFSAVKVGFKSRMACEEVKGLKDSVFLSREAPLLPLPNCTQNNACECRYIHLEDRRTYLRRDTDNGLPPQSRENERRARRDRRRQTADIF